jgi:hypothetical protein
MTDGLSVVNTRAGTSARRSVPACVMHAATQHATCPGGRRVGDPCVVYGDKKMLNRTTDSSPQYTTTLRASSAANMRTAGTSMPCSVVTPTTAGIKLCVLLPTLFSNSI